MKMNGDDVHDTFNSIMDGRYPYSWIGRLFVYSYQLLGMTSILNICIFIIEGKLLFDPLEYISNFFLKMHIILVSIWRSKTIKLKDSTKRKKK